VSAEFLKLLGVVLAIGVLLLSCRALPVAAELRRKSVHISLGLGCLSFPWIFDSFWPVLVLCLASLGAFFFLRQAKGRWKELLHGVERPSLGEFYFPISVTLLFALMRNPVTDYVIPLLVLTLADAMGALIGLRYGRARYSTSDGFKSLEGSLAFFLTAFLSTHVCLLLGSPVGRAESLLIATVIGALVMLVEAVAWRGIDNLLVPLASYALVHSYLEMSVADLVYRLALLGGILAFFGVLSRRTYAKDCVLIASALALYLIWAVAGWTWAMAPLLMAAVYSLLCPTRDRDWQTRHGLDDLAAVALPGLVWLLVFVRSEESRLLLPFVAAWSAQAAIITAAFLSGNRPNLPSALVLGLGGLAALLVGTPTLSLLPATTPLIWIPLLFLVGAFAAGLLWFFEWRRFGTTLAPGRPLRQFGYGLGVSLLGLGVFMIPPS